MPLGLIPLARLKRRYRAAPGRRAADRGERELAENLRLLRREMSARFGHVTSCATCATGCALPAGRWAGGRCCSGDTADVFSADELAALRLGGTRWRDLRRAVGDPDAGCTYRGARGCTLDPGDRPTVCLRYACDDLRRELYDRGELDAFEELELRMRTAHDELVAYRAACALAADEDALARALERAARR